MASVIQRSFTGGELSPALYARADQTKYAFGLRTCKNFIVQRSGGAVRRNGFEFICEVRDSTKHTRVLPFVFNSDQTYVLEVGDQYIRIIREGVLLSNDDRSVTDISNGLPCVVTYAGSDFSILMNEVYFTGGSGGIMDYLGGRNFKVANFVPGTNTFELEYMDGTPVDSTSFGAYGGGATVYSVYEVITPYLEADLDDLQFVQSADVITIVHPDYAPRELSRTGHTAWTLSEISFFPSINAGSVYTPALVSISGVGPYLNGSVGAAGSNTYKYRVTAVDSETGEESLPGYAHQKTITGITQANPAVVTAASHGYANGDIVFIDNVAGMTEVNGNTYLVGGVTANTFTLSTIDGVAVNSTGFTAYVASGNSYLTYLKLTSAAAPTTSAPNNINWGSVPGAVEYNIYRELNGVFGFVGLARQIGSLITFLDTGFSPDTTETHPVARNPFEVAGDYPAAVTYAQQRLTFASTDNNPETVYMSQSGNFHNYTTSSPLQDDDAVTFTLAGRQVNIIKHIFEIGGSLVVLTGEGEWSVTGDEAGIITPFDINAKQYGYNGSSTVSPILVGNTALFLQARGTIVRELKFDINAGGPTTRDLTVFSSHLFDNYSIYDWAYQKIPHSVAWAVRSDGALLGLTYLREHEVEGWHRHETQGEFQTNVVVPEGNEDALYAVVAREVDGRAVRYIERMAPSTLVDMSDAFYVDSGLTYDGRNTTAQTVTITGSPYTVGTVVTVTRSAGTWTSEMIGNAIRVRDEDGNEVSIDITGFTNGTTITGLPDIDVPASLQNVATTDWGTAIDEITNLWHLEGLECQVLGDGVVDTPITPVNGRATLSRPFERIHVGLGYDSDIETLDLEVINQETLSDKKKRMNRVTIFTQNTRHIKAGPDEDHLKELPVSNDVYSDNDAFEAEKVEIVLNSTWNDNGRVMIRQDKPLPMTILAVVPSGFIGG